MTKKKQETKVTIDVLLVPIMLEAHGQQSVPSQSKIWINDIHAETVNLAMYTWNSIKTIHELGKNEENSK